ncbi:MAG: ATP synthase F0 subunit B [Deltaproteobacteria bacterium]|nr:ATP synthase F0 subunit B [Deltaproteobacteria bacterium]
MKLLLFVALMLFPIYAYGGEETLSAHMMWRVINFVIFVAFLYYVLKKPAGAFFKNRREKIWKEMDDAEKSYQEAIKMLKEAEEKLSRVDMEIEKIISLNRTIGIKEAENISEKAKEMIEIIKRSKSLEKEMIEKNARREIITSIVDQAIEKAKKHLAEATDLSLHRKINAKSLAALGDEVR